MSPRRAVLREAYLEEVLRLGYVEDGAQLAAVAHLQRALEGLEARHKAPRTALTRLGGWLRRGSREEIRGVYLWGGVGRGKTFLMDLFFRAAPEGRKERVHFHRFMLGIHRELAAEKSAPDPLARVAARIAARIDLLCFDELFVADITDAMVLSRLFDALVGHGVTLVFTSNTEPRNLYRGGLQRERFLAAIELIERHCDVLNVDGGADYRLRTLRSAKTYLCPHDAEAERRLEATFRLIAGDEAVDDAPLVVHGREIPVRLAGEGVCWFEFESLCVGPRSKADYIELSRYFHTLLISDIPLLGIHGEDPARRFIELIDELYDRRVNVLVSAVAPPESLYRGERLAHGFARTASRLREFASPEYMATPHRP